MLIVNVVFLVVLVTVIVACLYFIGFSGCPLKILGEHVAAGGVLLPTLC